jgi:hypothetical protein
VLDVSVNADKLGDLGPGAVAGERALQEAARSHRRELAYSPSPS